MKKKHFTIKHFSLNLPIDEPDNKNTVKLLRHLANTLENYGDIEIFDIAYHPEGANNDDIPRFTVYYDLRD